MNTGDKIIGKTIRLQKIMSKNGWFKHEEGDDVFERLSLMLLNLSEDEQNLILELCERYNWITVGEYLKNIKELFGSIRNEHILGSSKIYLFPAIKPHDQGKTKSGNFLLYLIQGSRQWLPDPFKKIAFEVIERFSRIRPDKFKLGDNEYFIVLDDYMGSGKTISTTLSAVQNNKSIYESGRLIVLSLVAQEAAITFLTDNNIEHYFNQKSTKGISDYYETGLREEKLQIMERIESLIPFLGVYKFGFESSEALYTLVRTPNNTFPIFWKRHKIGDQYFEPPFDRF